MAYYVTSHSLDDLAWGPEVVGQADTIDGARDLLVAHLREEAEHHQWGPLYAMSADHLERHWPGGTGSIDVGVGAGIAEEQLTRQQFEAKRRECAADPDCDDAVPNYTTFTIADEHPEAAAARARGDYSLS